MAEQPYHQARALLERIRSFELQLAEIRAAAGRLLDDLTPMISIASVDEAVPEGRRAVQFILSRSGALGACSVRWTIGGDVDASDLADGQLLTGVIDFPVAAAEQALEVRLRDDAAFESDEALTVTLSEPQGCAIDIDSAGTTVSNDDVRVYRAGLPWRSGFRLPRNTYNLVRSEYPKLEAWRGRKLDVIDQFLGGDLFSRGWGALVSNYVLDDGGTLQATFDGGWTPAFAVPHLIRAEARRFDLCAAGNFDANHSAIAQRVAAIAGDRLIYIRLGWECNEGYPWSLQDDGAKVGIPDTAEWQGYYKESWARIARIYKSAVPGARMVWNHLKNTRRAMALYYPGDDVVDVIGMDPYDNGDSGFVVDEAAWVKFGGTWNSTAGRFTGPVGMVEFAKTRGKKVSFCEWGPSNNTQLPENGANNSFYVRRMFEFFQKLAEQGLLEYEAYFHAGGVNPHQIFPETSYNPLPRQAYVDCWRPALSAP